MIKSDVKPLAKSLLFLKSKRCGARTKRGDHKPCGQPAMPNGRCRLHGGKSTGPRTPEGKANFVLTHTKHGCFTKEAITEKRNLQAMMKWRHDLKDMGR